MLVKTEGAEQFTCADNNHYDDIFGEHVLFIAGESTAGDVLSAMLKDAFEHVHVAADAEQALALAERVRFSTVICAVKLPGGASGAELTRAIRDNSCCAMAVILLSNQADMTSAIASLQDLDAEFLREPVQALELNAVLQRARERRRIARENYLLHRETDQRPIQERVVGESEPIKEMWRVINRIAPMSATVLIKGETGTGKELAARALHDLSGRRGSFVPINCAAISPELIESELFGHVKGAFTGALQTRQGLFCHADGGTLFLDEIGEMPLAMQAKLLRVLEQRAYRPVGGNREIPTTARVVTATNRSLADEVEAGRFRKDLYYRINVLVLRIPPLRMRKSDIERLTRLYLHLLSVEIGVPTPVLDPWDLEAMRRYDWPGNIRELRNVVERSLLLGKPLSQVLTANEPAFSAAPAPAADLAPLKKVEESCILRAVREANGNKTAAARILGVSRKTVERRLKNLSPAEGVQ